MGTQSLLSSSINLSSIALPGNLFGLSESDAVDALRLPFYSSSHPTGSHGWRNQFDLGNPDLDRLLGLLSQTMGNRDQAMAHFEDALVSCHKAGYRPELAWSCCDYADALRERGGEGDRARAMALLDESLAISRELGMRPLMERVLSRREILRA